MCLKQKITGGKNTADRVLVFDCRYYVDQVEQRLRQKIQTDKEHLWETKY